MVQASDFGSHGLGVQIHPGVTILNMIQASLATCCEFATGLHIVGSGICALLEMRAETVQKWTFEIQWKG